MTETLAHWYSAASTYRESYPMNTHMTGFRCFLKIFACALDESRLSVERYKGMVHDTLKLACGVTS